MATQLDEILTYTVTEVNARKALADHAELARRAAAHQPRGFAKALRSIAETRPAVIAEIKKASPSKGLIRADFVPADLARQLESGGAAALSVLTDTRFFQGSLECLTQASAAVQIPCLRKDFMVDPFQIMEARAAGADAILLIAAALPDHALSDLRSEAITMGLDVLCEAHDRDEIQRAKDLGFDIIGVNSRDLRNFVVNTDSLIELAAHLPAGGLRVAESGIRTAEDITRMRAAGYHAFLIGEALMRHPDPGVALTALLNPQPSAGR